MRRVLVTRPEPGATRTARKLQLLGFSPVKLPLIEIVGLAVDQRAVSSVPSAVAITSANAILHAPVDLLSSLAAIACFAVGASTAAAAREAGFANVTTGPGDAEGLARLLLGAVHAGPVVYLCGRVRMPVFEAILAEAGLDVHAVETYDARRIDYTGEQVDSAIGPAPLDAVLLHSARTAEALVDLASCAAHGFSSETPMLCCLSEAIAAVVHDRLPGKIRIAAEPSEDALLSLLGAA